MEDIDRLREVAGAASRILRSLEAFGFEWEGPSLFQSGRTPAYAEAMAALSDAGLIYPCACSRKEIAESGRPGPEGPVYAGTCRAGLPPGRRARAQRVWIRSDPIAFQDRIQGDIVQDLALDVGDFVVRRVDGVHAYQLAVVVDDAFQGITHVVRGADLILSTPRQIYLQRALGLPTPAYAHLPLAVDAEGRKLSKSEAAAPVDPADPVPALLQAWHFLGQPPLAERPADASEFWRQAIPLWDPARIAGVRTRTVPPR